MTFYAQSALASREWTVEAGETLTVDLRRAGAHDRVSWSWRGATATAATASAALVDAPAAADWFPEDGATGGGPRPLTGPAAWLRISVTGAAATVQLLAPGPVEGTIA